MINIFSSFYARIKNDSLFLKKIRFYSILRFIVRTVANITLSLWFRCTQNRRAYRLIPSYKTENRTIVSFTSFPKRIGKVWMVVESILRQTVKPDMIILWLSREQFPSFESIPTLLLKLQKRGLQIVICEGDIRSHKKYYYAMKQYPNDTIITIDDDILYPSNMIASLVNLGKSNRDVVICRYAKKIKWRRNEILPYEDWESNNVYSKAREDLFLVGVGGTLFPKNILYKDIFNIELALQLTPLADDVWLNAMMRLNNVLLSVVPCDLPMLPIQYFSNITLDSINNGEDQNDKQIQAVRAYYTKELETDPFAAI